MAVKLEITLEELETALRDNQSDIENAFKQAEAGGKEVVVPATNPVVVIAATQASRDLTK